MYLIVFLQYICENHFQRLQGRSMFTGLKAINHFGRPDMPSFLKFVQKKHSYVSFKCVHLCVRISVRLPPVISTAVLNSVLGEQSGSVQLWSWASDKLDKWCLRNCQSAKKAAIFHPPLREFRLSTVQGSRFRPLKSAAVKFDWDTKNRNATTVIHRVINYWYWFLQQPHIHHEDIEQEIMDIFWP